MLQSYISAKIYLTGSAAGRRREGAAAGGGEGRSNIRSGRRPKVAPRRRRRCGATTPPQAVGRGGPISGPAEGRKSSHAAGGGGGDNAAAGGGEMAIQHQTTEFFTLRIAQAGLLNDINAKLTFASRLYLICKSFPMWTHRYLILKCHNILYKEASFHNVISTFSILTRIFMK